MGDNAATRDVAGGDTRNSQNSTYTVYLQAMYPLCPVPEDAKIAAEGVQEHLADIFSKVCAEPQPAAPKSVTVKWVEDIRSETVQANEIVIYFVKNFDKGVVCEHIDARLKDSNLDSDFKDALRTIKQNAHDAQGGANGHGGLTLVDDGVGVSEVFIDEAHTSAGVKKDDDNSGVKSTDYKDYKDGLKNWLGRFMANVAFHEAMHNKVEWHEAGAAAQDKDWDLHDDAKGGAGLADPSAKPYGKINSKNAQLMKKHMLKKGPKQYITSKEPPAATQTIGRTALLTNMGPLRDLLAVFGTSPEEIEEGVDSMWA